MEHALLEFDYIGMEDGGKIPMEHTGRGRNLSPEFVIKNLSPKAKTLAITLEDLTHPIKNFTHWVIWNLPAAERVNAGIQPGKNVPELGNARQGIGYGFHRYSGPKPPKGKTHTYRFTLYSLDCELDLGANCRKKNFIKKAEPHILQIGHIIGTFE